MQVGTVLAEADFEPAKWTVASSADRRAGARLRLFCFPYAGGGTAVFRDWEQKLSPDIDLYSIRLPGRESRWKEPPFIRLIPLVETLARVLRPLLNIPYAFFGHSLGALVSFELARQLRKENAPLPAKLLVSGARAPQIPDSDPLIHELPDSSFIEELRELNGIPDEVMEDEEVLHLMLPTIRADIAVSETYSYSEREPMQCPISAYGGKQDHKVKPQHLVAWNDQTESNFTLRMCSGDHFFLVSAREALLQNVSRDLTEVFLDLC